ncbi:hypothetical protein [Billgrantia desiderata]|uniref:hypothetical protein n=1 Tax=Billgrantia desiderata TaxID=52021 RepID=UPI001122E7FA|nr:hypothetical protein [Halomonas desiderata]
MLRNILVAVKWIKSLSAKFFRVVPAFTTVIVFLTLVSQLATLLASFLPLKVIIMLGSDGIPRYFPASFSEVDRDVLIAALSAGTVGFFLLHLLAERMIASVTSVSTSRLLSKSEKMVLFENQDEVAASSYQRYSRAFASVFFIALTLFGLGWFYPRMSIVITGYFLAVLLLFWLLCKKSSSFRERLESNFSPLLNLAGGVGFFVSFAFLVADFIFWSPPGVIIAIVSLLLSRQIMQRASGMVSDFTSLYRQRAKLDALFFHGKVLLPQQARPEKTLWLLLETENRQRWVAAVLNELVGSDENKPICRWQQLGTANVVGLIATRAGQQYLIKLFSINRSSWALHETTLMAELSSDFPAPRWVGTTQVEKFHCLVYELPHGQPPDADQVKAFCHQLRQELLAVQPQREALARYRRSKAMLWQRLAFSSLERLKVAADIPEQQQDLSTLLEMLPYLHQQLKTLPVVFFSPEINQDAMWIPSTYAEQSETPLLLNWGRWSLEPVGAGWPEAEKNLPSSAKR